MLKRIEAWFVRGFGRARDGLRGFTAQGGGRTLCLSARDFARLERLASIEMRHPDAQRMLLLLERCHVLPMNDVGNDFVQLGSRVSFDIDSSEPVERRIVPELLPTDFFDLSVVEPLGLALIGRKIGDVVVATCDAGDLATVMIHCVSNDNRWEH